MARKARTARRTHHLDFAKDCGYITVEQHHEMVALCQQVGKMLGSMINNPRLHQAIQPYSVKALAGAFFGASDE